MLDGDRGGEVLPRLRPLVHRVVHSGHDGEAVHVLIIPVDLRPRGQVSGDTGEVVCEDRLKEPLDGVLQLRRPGLQPPHHPEGARHVLEGRAEALLGLQEVDGVEDEHAALSVLHEPDLLLFVVPLHAVTGAEQYRTAPGDRGRQRRRPLLLTLHGAVEALQLGLHGLHGLRRRSLPHMGDLQAAPHRQVRRFPGLDHVGGPALVKDKALLIEVQRKLGAHLGGQPPILHCDELQEMERPRLAGRKGLIERRIVPRQCRGAIGGRVLRRRRLRRSVRRRRRALGRQRPHQHRQS